MLTIGPKPDEDRTRRQVINGLEFILKAYDPYGFWKVTCVKPNYTLPGQFTSLTEAVKAATNYSNSLPKIKKEA